MSSPENASISRRDYFYSLPYPLEAGTPVPYTLGLPSTNPLQTPDHPVEPTHTLVLTSSTKQFVDIRVFRPILPQDPELPNEGGPRERLDWAFAGTSSSVPIADPYPHGQVEDEESPHPLASATHPRTWPFPVTHASWTHWLDSRHDVDTASDAVPEDSGTMFPLNATQTLEFGAGINPATGQMHSYEEFWSDLEVLATPTAGDPDPLKYSIVLRLDEPEHGVRGLVVRVGQFCQGIVMKGDYCTVERWEWKEKEKERDMWGAVVEENGKEEGQVVGEWKRTVRIGDQFLPCAMCLEEGVLSLGGRVRYWDYGWVVEEKVAWREE